MFSGILTESSLLPAELRAMLAWLENI
jgi:hypothetical protein